jgi:hypothetical protein
MVPRPKCIGLPTALMGVRHSLNFQQWFWNDFASLDWVSRLKDTKHAKWERQISRSAFPIEQILDPRCYRGAAAMPHTPLWAFPP